MYILPALTYLEVGAPAAASNFLFLSLLNGNPSATAAATNRVRGKWLPEHAKHAKKKKQREKKGAI